jgi:hypothetical protein
VIFLRRTATLPSLKNMCAHSVLMQFLAEKVTIAVEEDVRVSDYLGDPDMGIVSH